MQARSSRKTTKGYLQQPSSLQDVNDLIVKKMNEHIREQERGEFLNILILKEQMSNFELQEVRKELMIVRALFISFPSEIQEKYYVNAYYLTEIYRIASIS